MLNKDHICTFIMEYLPICWVCIESVGLTKSHSPPDGFFCQWDSDMHVCRARRSRLSSFTASSKIYVRISAGRLGPSIVAYGYWNSSQACAVTDDETNIRRWFWPAYNNTLLKSERAYITAMYVLFVAWIGERISFLLLQAEHPCWTYRHGGIPMVVQLCPRLSTKTGYQVRPRITMGRTTGILTSEVLKKGSYSAGRTKGRLRLEVDMSCPPSGRIFTWHDIPDAVTDLQG